MKEKINGCHLILFSFFFFKIRITIKDWATLNSFIEEAISKKHHDVEFIFHKLCSLKAFLYVAPPNEVSVFYFLHIALNYLHHIFSI